MNRIVKPKGGHDDEKSEAERAVEQWKIKKLIKTLTMARGNGTSMISLIVPPKDQISRVNKMLGDEMGTASNIKSRVNRLSVLGAIVSVQQRLKLYNKVPPNGLVVYCGTVINEQGKEKKLAIDFEPFKPINTSLYLCDNKFHTEALQELLESDEKFGFIIMDGNGCLCGSLAGNHRVVLHKFSVDLPKKHGRGGQSAARFARLRLEKRQNYIKKCAELATQMFIHNDKTTVSGLVLAGNADFKVKLSQHDSFDPRLGNIIVKICDVSYGGENGFSQAIEQSADALSNQKFIREKKLLAKYFGEISRNTGKYVFGVKDTLDAISAVEEIIVWENLDIDRFELRHKETEEEFVKHFTPEQQQDTKVFLHSDGTEMEVVDKKSLLEWLAENYIDFGCKLSFVTDRSQEGSQFCQGFGGIGGLLRYQMDMEVFDDQDEVEIDSDEDAFGL